MMADDFRLAPGLFLQGTWLRDGVLNTKARRSRGNRLEESDRLCKSLCGQIECIDHILQTCAAIHAVRYEVYLRIGNGLRKLGLSGLKLMDLPSLTIAGLLKCYDVYTRGLNS